MEEKGGYLAELGVTTPMQHLGCFDGYKWMGSGEELRSIDPHNNEVIAITKAATKEEYELCIESMSKVEEKWKNTPGPVRGEIVRQIGEALRKYKSALGELLAHEVGKIRTEGAGEVQEFIDMCDLAVGMSRSIGGQVFPSERPGHFMMENYNPLGKIGVITAFNFPIAVLGWNTAVALICGNCVMVKGGPSTSLCTTIIARIIGDVMAANDFQGVFTCASGGIEIGSKMAEDRRLALISFTGSCGAGAKVSQVVHARFGKCILELGGNNAAVIMDDADLELALKAVTFSAVGTAG